MSVGTILQDDGLQRKTWVFLVVFCIRSGGEIRCIPRHLPGSARSRKSFPQFLIAQKVTKNITYSQAAARN